MVGAHQDVQPVALPLQVGSNSWPLRQGCSARGASLTRAGSSTGRSGATLSRASSVRRGFVVNGGSGAFHRQRACCPYERIDPSLSASLPIGTMTVLLAVIERFTGLPQLSQATTTAAAIAHLHSTMADIAATHGGVRLIGRYDSRSFVAVFSRLGDAAACALDLRQGPLQSLQLRISLHTDEISSGRETNLYGPAVVQSVRPYKLARDRKTVSSIRATDLAAERLPVDGWLRDLGVRTLCDTGGAARITELRPGSPAGEEPTALASVIGTDHRWLPLTRFIGRDTEIHRVRELLTENRMVTLTGLAGIGKTRLAVEVATAAEFRDGWCVVDLAPITESASVPASLARAMALPQQTDHSINESLQTFIGNRRMLIVLDSCEHHATACAALVTELLAACPQLTFLATSLQPIGVAGERTCRVPPMVPVGEAAELFLDRARLTQPDLRINVDSAAHGVVTEICQRLDGIPLAIELAAARVSSLSLREIADCLADRFGLLTRGTRTAAPRQQTLRASMDWCYALLADEERVLFCRLAVFVGGFDLVAAQAVTGHDDPDEPHRIVDQLSLLVDKSLVEAENSQGRMRYRMLETVRQYALEKLSEVDAPELRARHRAHYADLVALLDSPAHEDRQLLVEQAKAEIDNVRAAIAWSCERGDVAEALQLVCSLRPVWFGYAPQEGMGWLDSILDAENVDRLAVPEHVWARAVVDQKMLKLLLAIDPVGTTATEAQGQQVLALARAAGDPVAVVRALIVCGCGMGCKSDAAQPYFAEAADLANAIDDPQIRCDLLLWHGVRTVFSGEPGALTTAAKECRELAEAINHAFVVRQCDWWLGLAQLWQGNLADAVTRFRQVAAEAETANDAVTLVLALYSEAQVLVYRGASQAGVPAAAALETAAPLGPLYSSIA